MARKRKRRRRTPYEPLLYILPAVVAVILLVVLIFWVFKEDKKEEEAGILEEAQISQAQETLPVNEKEQDHAETAVYETQDTASAEVSEENESENAEIVGTLEQDEPVPSTVAADVGSMNDAEDPQSSTKTTQDAETGAEVDVSHVIVPAGETRDATLGIDVSKYQGTIDWAAVKSAGVDFAIIRVGYRTKSTGTIFEDPGARYNLQEATKNGIKVGAYFFSTAVNEAEAVEEAAWVADFISKYKITYPVAFNCEDFGSADSRQYHLTKEERTNLACSFLDTIASCGYTPMFYASRNEMEGSAQWDMNKLGSRYKVWVSQYPEKPFPETAASTYSGPHAMWQYTSQGKVYGIKGNVDVNVAYFGYSQEAEAKDPTPAEVVTANPEIGIDFTEVSERVTAKNETNLRNIPSTQESQVIHLLKNGEVIERTGIGSNGWDRVIYNGQKLYAVHNYLTTDLTASVPENNTGNSETGSQAAESGADADIVEGQRFTVVAEAVTARDKVNLRDKPSTETGNVVGVLSYGEAVVRTGISGTNDTGWSRLEVNGQIVYASSRLLATSMDYKEQEKPTPDNPEAGFHFTAASGTVRAKDVTNLRTLPTTNEPSAVVTQLSGDMTADRIAVDKDKGWTKLSYNGQIVYAVTNYLVVTE